MNYIQARVSRLKREADGTIDEDLGLPGPPPCAIPFAAFQAIHSGYGRLWVTPGAGRHSPVQARCRRERLMVQLHHTIILGKLKKLFPALVNDSKHGTSADGFTRFKSRTLSLCLIHRAAGCST